MEVPEASVSSQRSLLGSGTAETEAAITCLINWIASLQASGNRPFSVLALKKRVAKVAKSGTTLSDKQLIPISLAVTYLPAQKSGG